MERKDAESIFALCTLILSTHSDQDFAVRVLYQMGWVEQVGDEVRPVPVEELIEKRKEP